MALAETEDEATARRMIRQAGGRLFQHNTVNLASGSKDVFAICPFSLLAQQVNRLLRSADFKMGSIIALALFY